MFRVVSCVAACVLAFTISFPAGAQSSVSVGGESEITSPAPLGPPKSITQHYVPHGAAPARALGLLVEDAAPVPGVSLPGLAVTSSEPVARTAAAQRGVDHPVIVVSHMKGAGRE